MDLESLPSRVAPATALGGQAAVTMEAALSELGPERDLAAAMLRGCIDGNRRFMAGLQAGCLNSERRRLELVDGQFPGAVVVACSDSRVPPELLLDQGIGDLFVVRVAGNIVDRQALGSIEYALRHLGTRLVLVMGHTKCGAVKASLAEFVESAKAASERIALAQEEEESVSLAAFDNLSLGDDATPPTSKQQEDGGGNGLQQQLGSPVKGWGGLGGPSRFFARLLWLLGGEQEAATLVRTASFRDKDHLENPINDIVRAVKPAVKQVVWDLLHQAPPSRAASLEGPSPGLASPVNRASSASLGDCGAGAMHTRDDSAAGTGAEQGGCGHGTDDGSCSCGLASFPGSPPPAAAARGVHFASGMQSPKARGAGGAVDTKVAFLKRQSVDIEALHQRLHQHAQAQEFCFDQHILASTDVTNEVIYENVRRTCATVWHEMEKWLPRDILQSTLMATAVYDLDSGHIDFFGLHS